MESSPRARFWSVIAAALFVVVAIVTGYRRIGLPPVIIVGGSSLIALVLWSKTYLWRPLDSEVILPVFLLTVAALEVHSPAVIPSTFSAGSE
jgi:Flp pilus assembly protein TadB